MSGLYDAREMLYKTITLLASATGTRECGVHDEDVSRAKVYKRFLTTETEPSSHARSYFDCLSPISNFVTF